MSLELPTDKRGKLLSLLAEFSPGKVVSLRQWSSFVGSINAACPAVKYGRLYTKRFERVRYLELLKNNDNYEAKILIPESLSSVFDWWRRNIPSSSNPIRQGNYTRKIFSDASTTGWGAFCDGHKARGFWTEREQKFHINRLELLAALFAIKSFAKEIKSAEILLRMDNTTAIAKTVPDGRHIIRESFRRRGLPGPALDIFEASIAESTRKQYAGPLTQWWWVFCVDQGIDPYQPREEEVIKFLTKKFEDGAAYGSLNSIRSAISLISGSSIGQNRNISRFFKGVFMLRPTKPKYDRIWDVSVAFQKIEEWFPLNELALDCLGERLVLLLALGTAHRAQTLALIKLSNMKHNVEGYEVEISDRIKTSRPGAYQPLLILPYFSENPKLCIASTLDAYIQQTSHLRGDIDHLFLTTKRPFRTASAATIGR
ncbi:hypothetical protein X777_08690 [Ooceraea biroi]|uniref:Tyr recombinase domain-containing protein n=1 Tax=Ooceraea biroi TaxID=2015173 RepID=A0A026W7V6_OOCBI|nr:hypothetical protein X777_08690 [Ooceraea biroi]